MHRRFGAPLGGEAAHAHVGVLIEAEEVTDNAAVQESTVGVGVSQVRWPPWFQTAADPMRFLSTCALKLPEF